MLRRRGFATMIRIPTAIAVLAMTVMPSAVARPAASIGTGSLGKHHTGPRPGPGLMAVIAVALLGLNAATLLHRRARQPADRAVMAGAPGDLAAD